MLELGYDLHTSYVEHLVVDYRLFIISPGDVCENEAQFVELSSCCASAIVRAGHGKGGGEGHNAVPRSPVDLIRWSSLFQSCSSAHHPRRVL